MLTDMWMSGFGVVVAIFLVVFLVSFVVTVIRGLRTRRTADAADGVIATLSTWKETLRLTSTSLIEGYERGTVHSLLGLKASIDDSDTVNGRLTVARTGAVGMTASVFPETLHDRELYLTVEGPRTFIVFAVARKNSQSSVASARGFAALINQTATALAATDPAPAPPVPSQTDASVLRAGWAESAGASTLTSEDSAP